MKPSKNVQNTNTQPSITSFFTTTTKSTNQKNQHLINYSSNILSRTKTSVMIDNIIVATKEKLQTIKRKESKRKKKQKQKMQYPQNSSSTSSYVPTKSSKPYPKTSLPSSIDNHNLPSSYHSDNSNSLSSFTSNDCSHQSSLHQEHKTKKYFQKELLFDPIYNNRPSITIPPPTHTPLLQYPISYPYLHVNNIISNTNISHSVSTSFSSQNCSTISDQPNHQSSSNTSQSYSPSFTTHSHSSSERLSLSDYPVATSRGIQKLLYLDEKKQQQFNKAVIHYPSSSSSILHNSPITLNTHEPNKTNKQYHETKVQKARLYHPLRHQQGVWSYSRFHQYCTSYPGVSSNDSNSSLSSDNQSEDDSSISNPYISCSETPVMICLPINKKTRLQYHNIAIHSYLPLTLNYFSHK